jgi:hypothetical protein
MLDLRVLAVAALVFSAMGSTAVRANEAAFFSDVQGQWSGPGEIVAGKYKGTKFNCDLKGIANEGGVAVELDGSCRVGVFTQPMKATVKRSGKSYKGKFLDGAAGKGLDIISGNVNGSRMVFSLVRDQLKGAMSARVSGKDDMNVTISVKVESEMVPVIAMSLKRVDAKSTAAVD